MKKVQPERISLWYLPLSKIGVDVNIISGKVDYLKDLPYGTLLVELIGEEAEIKNALQYIYDKKVKVEVIGYVA